MGKNKIPLDKQIDTCNRRIQGHLNNPNSNPERLFRLLERLAKLENLVPKGSKKKKK